jgi:hypothetical protein
MTDLARHSMMSKHIDVLTPKTMMIFDVTECDEMTNRWIWCAKERILFVMMRWQWFPTYLPPANYLPHPVSLRATMYTPISSWIKNYELDKGHSVRDMIREFLRSTVTKRATKSQERVTRVMMARVNQLEDIEEHDDEIFLCVFCILSGAYRVLS